MYPRYYALRRVNPYRGVVQIVEVGEVTAHSFDGVAWHLRADDGYGWVRPTGIWIEGEGLKAGHAKNLDDILPALETRPPCRFPSLIHRNSGCSTRNLACPWPCWRVIGKG